MFTIKKFKDFKSGIKYATWYYYRVPISENRITYYDSTNATFSYTDHKAKNKHTLTVSAFEFITMLLRNFIPSIFEIIRYYGFYRKKPSIHFEMIYLVKPRARISRTDFDKYRYSILFRFNSDPYVCLKCGFKLIYYVFIN